MFLIAPKVTQKRYSGHVRVVQVDSYRKAFPIFRERKAGSCIVVEGTRLLPETADRLLFCLKPKASAMALPRSHVAAVSGAKIMTMKVSAWGMSLNTEVQHSKPQVTCINR